MPATVVCGVSDSDENRDVLRVAKHLAQKLGLSLTLVHVVPLPVPVAPTVGMVPVADVELEDDLIESGRSLLTDIVAEMSLPAGTEQRIEIGTPVDRILGVAEDAEAALVVVGSHGRGAVASAFLGSVSTNIAAHAPCPVVVVSPHAIKTGIRL
jgi:nucleotide-binding universal stress UspA family protein